MRGDAAPVYGESGRPKSQRASRLSSGLEVRVGDLALDYGGFHSTVLVYFRDRLDGVRAGDAALEVRRFCMCRWDEKASRVLESTVGNLCREQSGLAVKQ